MRLLMKNNFIRDAAREPGTQLAVTHVSRNPALPRHTEEEHPCS
jgi:hypothetical protein